MCASFRWIKNAVFYFFMPEWKYFDIFIYYRNILTAVNTAYQSSSSK